MRREVVGALAVLLAAAPIGKSRSSTSADPTSVWRFLRRGAQKPDGIRQSPPIQVFSDLGPGAVGSQRHHDADDGQ